MITEKAIEKLKAMRKQAEINAAGNRDSGFLHRDCDLVRIGLGKSAFRRIVRGFIVNRCGDMRDVLHTCHFRISGIPSQ